MIYTGIASLGTDAPASRFEIEIDDQELAGLSRTEREEVLYEMAYQEALRRLEVSVETDSAKHRYCEVWKGG